MSRGAPGVSEPRGQARGLEAWGKWLLRMAISTALLAFVISRIDAGRFVDLAARTHWSVWASGLALTLLAPAAAAQRFRVLIRGLGHGVSFGSVLAVNLESMTFSLVNPVLGGLVRWERISRHTADRVGALTLQVTERLLDGVVLALAAGAGASLLFVGELAPRLRSTVMALAIAAAVLALLATFVGTSRSSLRAVRGWRERSSSRVAVLLGYLERLLEAGRTLAGNRRLSALALFWTVTAWCISVAGSVVMARAVFPSMPVVPYAAATAALTLVVLLPVTFAGLGLRELSLPLLLGSYGVTEEVGLLVGLSAFVPFLVMALAGLVARLMGRNRLMEVEGDALR